MIFFSYPLFVTMMVCEEKSFCPDEVLNIYDNQKTVQQQKIIEDTSCRALPVTAVHLIRAVAAVFTCLCVITKAIIDCTKTKSVPENIELEELRCNPQSAPLPPFQNTRRLHQSTLMILVLTTIVLGTVHAVVFYNGNLFVSFCMAYALTLIVPSLTMVLERRILCFSLSLLFECLGNNI